MTEIEEDEIDPIYKEGAALDLKDREALMIWDDYSGWMNAGWLDTSFGVNSLEEFLREDRPIHIDEFPNGYCPEDLRMMIDDLTAVKRQIEAARMIIKVAPKGHDKEVVAAAINYMDTGEIISLPAPARHCDIIFYAHESLGKPRPVRGTQGFLLRGGIFAMRKAARRMAIKHGQVTEEKLMKKDSLYSEDLW